MSNESPNKLLIIPTVFCIIIVLAFIVFQITKRRRAVIKTEIKWILWMYIAFLIATVVLSIIGFVCVLIVTSWDDLKEDANDLHRRIEELNTRIDSSKRTIDGLSTAVFDIQSLISNQPETALANVRSEFGLDTLQNNKTLDLGPLGSADLETWVPALFYNLKNCGIKFESHGDLRNSDARVNTTQKWQNEVSEALDIQQHWKNLAIHENSGLGSTHQHVKSYLNTVQGLLDQYRLLFQSSPGVTINSNKKEIDDVDSLRNKLKITVSVFSLIALLIAIVLLCITVFSNFKPPPRWFRIVLVIVLVIAAFITIGISVFLSLSIFKIWNISHTCSSPTVPKSFNSTFIPFKGNSTKARNVFEQCQKRRKVFSLSKIYIEVPPLLKELKLYETKVNADLKAISEGRDNSKIDSLRLAVETVENIKKELDSFKGKPCLNVKIVGQLDKNTAILENLISSMKHFLNAANKLKENHQKIFAAMSESFQSLNTKLENAVKAVNADLEPYDFECTDFLDIFAKKSNEICARSNEFFNKKLIIAFCIVLGQYFLILLLHLVSCILLIIKKPEDKGKPNGTKLESSKTIQLMNEFIVCLCTNI